MEDGPLLQAKVLGLCDRHEAAAVDLCLEPIPDGESWETQKGIASDVGEHAREKIDKADAERMVTSLVKRGLLKLSRGDYHVTETGVVELLMCVGLDARLRGRLRNGGIPAGLVGELAAWLRSALEERTQAFLRASRVPLRLPRRREGRYDLGSLLDNWYRTNRSWKIVALLQEACAAAWWAKRDEARFAAVFELNRILVHSGMLASWTTGVICDQHDGRVHHERLALEQAASSTAQRVSPVGSHRPVPQLGESDWSASELELQRTLVVPLLQARGLCDVSEWSGPNEYGKDVVGWYEPPLSYPRWVAVQVKKSLSGNAAKHEMTTLQEQVKEAFRMKILDPKSKAEHLVSEVWIVVLSPLTAKTRIALVQGQEDPVWKANVRVFDRAALVDLLIRHNHPRT